MTATVKSNPSASFAWDSLHNELSEDAKLVINKLALFAQQPPPLPAHLATEEAVSATSPRSVKGEPIQSEQQFMRWYNQFEHEGLGDDEIQHYPDLLESIEPYMSAASELTKEIEEAEQILNAIEEKHLQVAKITDLLNKSAERLVIEEKHMNQVAESLRKNLGYFEELDSLTKKFNNPTFNVQDAQFLPLLTRVDECIAFMTENRTFMEAELYLLRFKQLQSKGLTLLKNFITNIFKESIHTLTLANVTVGSNTALKAPGGVPVKEELKPLASTTDEGQMFGMDEISAYYLKLKGQSSRVKHLIAHIESKLEEREYQSLYTDCTYAYVEMRRLVLFSPTQAKLSLILQSPSITLKQIIISAVVKLASLTEAEVELVRHFFSKDLPSLRTLIESLTIGFFDIIRSKVIFMESLDDLLTLNEALRVDVLDRELKLRGPSVDSLRPIVKRLVEDVQERLLFVTSLIIRDDIESFVPSEADLDYPQVLLKAQRAEGSTSTPLKASGTLPSLPSTPSSENLIVPAISSPNLNTTPTASSTAFVASPIQALSDFASSSKGHTYFPTLNRTLALLSKLYLSVDHDAFDTVALAATNACVGSLKRASLRVIAKSGAVDGALFLLSHLFVLETKLRPFDINFVSMETSLDFSSIISAVKALLTGQKSLFALSRDNALFNVIASSAPRIKTIQIDSKKEMETLAQQTTEDLIDSISLQLLSNISTFIVQANAVLNSALASGGALGTPSAKLKEMQFAQPEAVNALIADLDSTLKAKLPPFMDKVRLYCAATIDRQRVFKPLKTKILDSVMRLKQILNREYSSSEITPASIAALDSTTLSRFLDSTLIASSAPK